MDLRAATSPPRIVMVDDEPANLHIVKIILNREAVAGDLVLFESGQDALDFLAAHPVDLVLLDLAMPGMDGFEVLRRMKAEPAMAEIPVLFLSAFTDTEYILKAFELGATDFIGKPIISPILTARIRAVMQTQALKKQLQVSNEELVSTNRLKDELLSIVSHDLRSPLSAIELLCQFLQDVAQGKGKHSQEDLIHRVLNQSRLARRLVENLLNLNRVEEGILVPNASFFVLRELVEACAEDEQPIFEAHGIAFDLQAPPDELLCYGDREMIAQVLRNVLGNAVKFAAGRVSLTCELRGFTAERGGTVRCTVADDGAGIPPDQRDVIFEKYGKGDRRGGGSGLGLYISRKMVELHGGTIDVDVEAGRRTAFCIDLPNVFRAEQLPELSEYNQSRILVVSSSKAGADLLEGLLLEAGLVNVETAVQDDDARPDAAGPVDVAVLDAGPGMVAGDSAERLLAGLPEAGAWLCLGAPEQAETLAGASGRPCTALERPLNPLALLRALAGALSGDASERAISG